MAEGKRRIDRILADAYLDGLSERSVDDVRALRKEVSTEETLVSYERRLLHARLAILRAELGDRAGGRTGISIVDRLPEILGGDDAPSRGAFPTHDVQLDFQVPQRRVSKLVSDDTLANIASLPDEELARIIEELVGAEGEVSETRRALLNVLDKLNAELADRYRRGEADPGDVLARG